MSRSAQEGGSFSPEPEDPIRELVKRDFGDRLLCHAACNMPTTMPIQNVISKIASNLGSTHSGGTTQRQRTCCLVCGFGWDEIDSVIRLMGCKVFWGSILFYVAHDIRFEHAHGF